MNRALLQCLHLCVYYWLVKHQKGKGQVSISFANWTQLLTQRNAEQSVCKTLQNTKCLKNTPYCKEFDYTSSGVHSHTPLLTVLITNIFMDGIIIIVLYNHAFLLLNPDHIELIMMSACI